MTGPGADPVIGALLDGDLTELYENAPCGYLSTLPDGKIVRINATLLGWLGRERADVVGRLRFSELLTVGGRLYHETHFAPLLRLRGEVSGIALELRTADGGRLPALVTSMVKRAPDGTPSLIRTTVFDARERRSYEQELLRGRRAAEEAHREADAHRTRLQETLGVLQRSLLPPDLPPVPGMAAAAHYHPASPDQLGGDFYDLFPLDRTRWEFFLGDVCGKGPEAATVTSLVRYTLRTTAVYETDPVAALDTLNTALYRRHSGREVQYCTAVCGVLAPHDGVVDLELASGGHPPALVLRADGGAHRLPTPGGMLIGALPDPAIVRAATTLHPGDTLLLYTDGLIEGRTGADRALYGEDALLALAAELAPAPPAAVIERLRELLAEFGPGLTDDTALLAIGVPAVDVPA